MIKITSRNLLFLLIEWDYWTELQLSYYFVFIVGATTSSLVPFKLLDFSELSPGV